ncbi:MAG: hypothetical protein WB765_18700 [Acidimicrobiales bacterium]
MENEATLSDTIGGRSEAAHRTTTERLCHAGGVPTTALSVTTEPFRGWASILANPASDVMYWYSTEVPMLTDQMGAAQGAKVATAEHGAH